MNELAASLLDLSRQIAEQIAEKNGKDEHRRVILAQLTFANQIFEGIRTVCEKQNGLSAESLVRTLFEVLIGMAILAKHPERLADFVDHGRMTVLRLMRFIKVPALQQRLGKRITATETEFQRLWARFKDRPWHGVSTKDSFRDAEFGDDIYDRYYRRASAFAHGQPYVILNMDPTTWRNVSVRAENLAMLLLKMSLALLNREFKLGLDQAVATLNEQLQAHLKKDMDQIEKNMRD